MTTAARRLASQPHRTLSDGEIRSALHSIDWSFPESDGKHGIHSIHPYPAKFISEIPRHLIRLLHPRDGSAVFDPFCGSGTTLVEAIQAGHRAIGVDLNPIAVLISRTKTTPLQCSLQEKAHLVVSSARRERRDPPDIPRLSHWFKPEVSRTLASLTHGIAAVKDPAARNALEVALSRILVRVSNQESDTRYAAIEKSVGAQDVLDLFLKSASLVERALRDAHGGLFSHRPECEVIEEDILEVTPKKVGRQVGLVVTSPPYPNAYEYWLYHKYRMYWLGMDPVAVREREIGARPHYFKKNHQTEHDFERQMSACFKLLAQVLLPGGLACFLVGRSIIHGRTIDNAALLERAAQPHGFRLVTTLDRNIRVTRKAFNPAHGEITREHILVFASTSP